MSAAMKQPIVVDGAPITVRPIAISDVERLSRLFERLSPDTVHFRFFSPIRRPPRVLLRLADVDHDRRACWWHSRRRRDRRGRAVRRVRRAMRQRLP